MVTTTSRIIGVLLFRPQRVSGFAQAVAVFFGLIGADAPVQHFILRIALAERKGDLGLGELRAKIEGVRAISLDAEFAGTARKRRARRDGRRD